ncbi:MAG: AAA family ATPase [Solobacterium sp.]|nr:AAA family ATPase [Solobacterium sp.]
MNRNYIRGIKMEHAPQKDRYLKDLPIVKYLLREKELVFDEPVTFFVGENGTGKSTLLEAIAIAVGFNPEGGSKDFQFETHKTHSELYELITVIKGLKEKDGFFLRAESFYNTSTYIEENTSLKRYGNQSFHTLSHGEAFLSLIQNRFEGKGLYILDEPEAALSPQRLLTLLCEIHRFVKDDSQFIIATHSPILMAYPKARILLFSEEGIQAVAYRDTEHYKVMKQFMDNPERMLKYLMEEEEV